MRRRRVQYSSLTSLLDVLFILLFASLARATGIVEQDRAAAAARLEPAAPIEPIEPIEPRAKPAAPRAKPTVPRAKPTVVGRSRVELRAEALARLARGFERRQPVYVRVSAEGVVVAIEVGTEPGGGDLVVGVPLLEKVPDPDVGISYLGDRSAELRICTIVMHNLDRDDLGDLLVVIAPEVPLGDLPVALAVGLQRDQERCRRDAQGAAIVVDPIVEGKTP